MLIDGATPTIKFALGENPKRSAFSLPIPGLPRRYPATRMGVANSIRRAFLRARDYAAEWDAYNAMTAAEQAATVPPRRDLQLDALVEILNDERAFLPLTDVTSDDGQKMEYLALNKQHIVSVRET